MSSRTSRADALFDLCVKTPEGGKAGTYATAVCGSCGAKEDVFASASAGRGAQPSESLSPKFRKLGWRIGSRKGKHTCPDCQKRQPKPKADPPAQPKPEDRRAILEALEIVFCSDDGFDEGYDDTRVAEEQNVPRRWVEDIREQFIGPIPKPKVDHAAAAAAELVHLEEELAKAMDVSKSVVAAFKDLQQRSSALSQHLAILKEGGGRPDGS